MAPDPRTRRIPRPYGTRPPHRPRRQLDGAQPAVLPRPAAPARFFRGGPVPGESRLSVVRATPGAGTHVPLYILGSSLFGAQLAALLGLPYAFASHFAPAALVPALQVYRDTFQPSKQLDRPHVMLAANVIIADTDAEAKRLATSQQRSFIDGAFRRKRTLLQPPIDSIEDYWQPHEKAQLQSMLSCSFIGSPETVRAQVEAFTAEH